MPTIQSDRRMVVVKVTETELATLLGEKAKAAGLIDFDPDTVEVINAGKANGWEIIFTQATTAQVPA